MKVPIEISYKNLTSSERLNGYVRQRAGHLERPEAPCGSEPVG